MFDGVKDHLDGELMKLLASGKLGVERKDWPMLLSVVKASVDAGYGKAARTFDKSVATVLKEISPEQTSSKK